MSPKILFILIIFIIYSFFIKIPIKSLIKIMCMGDSITYGHKMPGGYRKFLYHNLISKGYKIKMVGAKDNKIEKYYYNENNSPEYFKYQDDNCGFSAFAIKAYGKRKGLYEIIKKNKCLKLNPDIILLLIGTNNAMDNYNFNETIKDFISLMNYLLENINKDSIIFVATIPDMDPNTKIVYTWFKNYRKNNLDDNDVKNNVNNYIKKYNNEIKKIIEEYRNKNKNIRIEDLNKEIKDIDNLFFDGVHPNNQGHKIIGEFWTGIIDRYLNEKMNKF